MTGHQCDNVCPDCNADTELVVIGDGLAVLQVLHDDTCPYLTGALKETP